MNYIKKNVYADLCGFIPCLYAITLCNTLCQRLYQVYATRAPLGFIPGRLLSCKNLQHLQTFSKLPQYPQDFFQPTIRILNNMLPSSAPRPRGSPRQPWPLGRSPMGRPFSWIQFDSGHGGGFLRDVLTHESSFSSLLYDGLCRDIVLFYAGTM